MFKVNNRNTKTRCEIWCLRQRHKFWGLRIYQKYKNLNETFLSLHIKKDCNMEKKLLVEIIFNVKNVKSRSTFTWDPKWTQTVWNLRPLWNVVPFTWQFTWRFHCGIFPNNSKTLLHMCKWYLFSNANLINAKKCYRW